MTPSHPILIRAQGLGKRFTEADLDVPVLQGIDLEVAAGQTLAIVGVSGSGKSTLLHLLGGLDVPTAGRIELCGRDWASMSPREQGDWRNRHLGFMYQFHHLLPEFSALDNVAMPLLIRRMGLAESRQQAREALNAVGLAQRTAHRPSELSGGERQRVAVARALVTRPSCLLADEPTGNLDRSTAETVFDLMLSLAQARGAACVLVTHDEALAQRCQTIRRLEKGRLA